MQTEKTNPWLIAFRILFTAALIGCIFFIFGNSLQDGAASSARSQAILQKINALLGRVHLGPLSEHLIRKLAHFAEFTLLGFLLMLCLRVYTARFVRHTSWPLLGGMATALTDETLQSFVPGRTASVRDVWIDMGGVVAGLFAALLLLLLVRLLMAFWRVTRENKRLRAENAALERERQAREYDRLAHRAAQRAAGHEEEQP